MKKNNIVILSANSDIGAFLTKQFLQKGANVIGTYRNPSPILNELEAAGAILLPLDITSKDQVSVFAEKLKKSSFAWNQLISASGVLNPIGNFFSTEFDIWEKSVITNSIAQLRVLHAIYDHRDTKELSKVVFFAGGGTNGPFDNYSAYCIGKHILIKMTELLDSESCDLQVAIIGTGFVNTKIHHQTLAAGFAAGDNYLRTRAFVMQPEGIVSTLEDVAECVNWCLSSPRSVVSGRNFSVVHDPWREPNLLEDLVADPNLFKLRRAT